MANGNPTETMGVVERITDQVFRIPLSLPLRDLRAINCFVILGADGLTLVDPGWASEANESLVLSALKGMGYGPEDVQRILVTHGHWDHYTQAVAWQRRFGSHLYLGRQERHSIEGFDERRGAYPNQADALRRAGAGELAKVIEALPLEPYERNVPLGAPDTWLDGGEEIDCGGVRVLAHATPGHTRGHFVFEMPTDGLLFTGDHILPRITPSIAFEGVPERLPLRSYLSSLRLFQGAPDTVMLAAHGEVGGSVRQRVHALLDHHEERLETMAGLVASGCETTLEVAQGMRWTRREREVEELGAVHGMAAILEVEAHLELLAHSGELVRDTDDLVIRYAKAT